MYSNQNGDRYEKVKGDTRSLIEEILSDHQNDDASLQDKSMIALCIDAQHPVLAGRIKVRLGATDRWLATLHGMTFRKNDRVLVQYVSNSDEPIVVGVVDGFSKRPKMPRPFGPVLTVEHDESVKVVAANGEGLLEVYCSDEGPVVKLLRNDIHVRLPGRLSVSATAIALNAEQGGVRIAATDDVEVSGEEIRLN